MRKIVILLGCIVAFFSCDVAQQLLGTVNMTQCKYEYKSVSGLTLAGVNVQNVTSISSLNPLTAANLLAAFASSSLPMSFTLNLNVSNPGVQEALLNGMNYVMEVDGVQLTQGSLSQQFQVPGGGATVLPISMAFDLKQVLSGKSADAVKNLAFNLIGFNSEASNITLRVKPNFTVGGQVVSAPNYIPISFQFKR